MSSLAEIVKKSHQNYSSKPSNINENNSQHSHGHVGKCNNSNRHNNSTVRNDNKQFESSSSEVQNNVQNKSFNHCKTDNYEEYLDYEWNREQRYRQEHGPYDFPPGIQGPPSHQRFSQPRPSFFKLNTNYEKQSVSTSSRLDKNSTCLQSDIKFENHSIYDSDFYQHDDRGVDGNRHDRHQDNCVDNYESYHRSDFHSDDLERHTNFDLDSLSEFKSKFESELESTCKNIDDLGVENLNLENVNVGKHNDIDCRQNLKNLNFTTVNEAMNPNAITNTNNIHINDINDINFNSYSNSNRNNRNSNSFTSYDQNTDPDQDMTRSESPIFTENSNSNSNSNSNLSNSMLNMLRSNESSTENHKDEQPLTFFNKDRNERGCGNTSSSVVKQHSSFNFNNRAKSTNSSQGNYNYYSLSTSGSNLEIEMMKNNGNASNTSNQHTSEYRSYSRTTDSSNWSDGQGHWSQPTLITNHDTNNQNNNQNQIPTNSNDYFKNSTCSNNDNNNFANNTTINASNANSHQRAPATTENNPASLSQLPTSSSCSKFTNFENFSNNIASMENENWGFGLGIL